LIAAVSISVLMIVSVSVNCLGVLKWEVFNWYSCILLSVEYFPTCGY
jgi:hypothetical protein